MRVKIVLLISLFCLPLVAQAKAQEFVLDNGLKLIVKEDHRAPVVVSQIWYKVGSSYETGGITGVSHVLEHMMFKGTEAHAPGEFSRIIAENGGRENAFTSRDYTAYFQRLEQSRLALSFELEADRMRNLRLREEEFRKEVQVVMEERRMRTEDDPQSLTYERFQAVAFMNSPYRNPVIGWMNDLENMQLADLQDWYERWYAPNNATLVVVGDVKADSVHALAKKYFGAIKPAEVKAPKPREEVQQRGPQRIKVRVPAELPYLLMGYKVTVLRDAEEEWEPYALEVLAGVLGSGGSARLSRELVRGQEIASSASVSYGLYSRLPGLLMLDATPAPGHGIAKLEAALRDQVRRLRDEPVSAQELERIKAQVVADTVFERDSGFYQAMQIGRLETVGLSWRHGDEYAERVRAITADQVRAVARKYLVEDGLTVAEMDPLPMQPGSTPGRKTGGSHGH